VCPGLKGEDNKYFEGEHMTEELKKAIESAQTEEDKKAVVEKFKDEIKKLQDEELEGVAGGKSDPSQVKFWALGNL